MASKGSASFLISFAHPWFNNIGNNVEFDPAKKAITIFEEIYEPRANLTWCLVHDSEKFEKNFDYHEFNPFNSDVEFLKGGPYNSMIPFQAIRTFSEFYHDFVNLISTYPTFKRYRH